MAKIVAIHPDELNKWWPSTQPLVDKALEKGHGEMDSDDIHSMIEDGDCILILAVVGDNVAAAIVTTLVARPALRELIILTAGGCELDEWLDEVMFMFDKLAREQQAEIISIHGRRGWVGKLKKYGYNEAYTTVIKEVL